MPADYMRDTIPKTLGIRNGEPKRPESLIEMPGIVPEVPEVSLCLNQERNNPLQSNSSNPETAGNILRDHIQREENNEILYRNKYESYNTWKAKNAQALYNITGSLERNEAGSKHLSSTKKSGSSIRKQNSGKEIQSVQGTGSPKYFVCDDVPVTSNSTSSARFITRQGLNPSQMQESNTNQQCNSYSVEPQARIGIASNSPILQQRPNHLQRHIRDSKKYCNGSERIVHCSPRPSSNIQNPYQDKDSLVDSHSYSYQLGLNGKQRTPGLSEQCIPNYCKCPFPQQRVLANPPNVNEFINEEPFISKDIRANEMQNINPKVHSFGDPSFISNQLSTLYHLINSQNEQMSMLRLEINAQKLLISTLHEQVKEICIAVSSNMPPKQLFSTKEKSNCQCSCTSNNDQVTKHNVCTITDNSKIKMNTDSTDLNPSNSIDKRSVGVMTSSMDNTIHGSNDSSKTQAVKDSDPKNKKQYFKQKPCNSLSISNKKRNQKEQSCRTETRKKQSLRRKNKEDEKSKVSSQSDDSFSLDEAAAVTRAEPELGSVSPDVSIHVDMPDYSSSYTQSATSDSSDIEDEGQESGSGGESSDPQIGWTFYDRVVGQVNNLLRQPSNDPRQEYIQTQRKNAGNVLQHCNGDYETENNWSKRVTFDGPPIDDSDNNGMHMPRYHQFRTNPDYRITGGPERLQDFVMCDYANGGTNLSLVNGSTNVSFATYRYYQRHQLLPPHPGMKVSDHMFQEPSQTKKSKSRKVENTPPMSQKSQKRKNGRPPSKILDMSALKQQPKLF